MISQNYITVASDNCMLPVGSTMTRDTDGKAFMIITRLNPRAVYATERERYLDVVKTHEGMRLFWYLLKEIAPEFINQPGERHQ